MAPRNFRSISVLFLTMALLLASFPQVNVYASASSPALPGLGDFVGQLEDGEAGVLRGMYVQDILAARVVQQPAGRSDFVSPRKNILTQFGLASRFGATGLLAHNYLSGASFSLLKPGQLVYLVYGDGKTSVFVVKELLSYQAVDPLSTTSNFIDLKTKKVLTAGDLMNKVYNRPDQLILQTCIEKDRNLSWGRLFVIAEPYTAA
jgi:hypothetical protein